MKKRIDRVSKILAIVCPLVVLGTGVAWSQSNDSAAKAAATSAQVREDEQQLPAIKQAASQGQSARVYLAGSGTESQLPTILDDITDFLKDEKVVAKTISGGSKARDALLDEVRSLRGESLLQITVDISEANARNSLIVKCYSVADGTLLWQEEVKGALVAFSFAGEVKTMLNKAKKALTPHVGKTGLPVN